MRYRIIAAAQRPARLRPILHLRAKALACSRIDHFQTGCAQKAAPAMLRHALQRAAPTTAAAARTYLSPPKQRWHLIDASR